MLLPYLVLPGVRVRCEQMREVAGIRENARERKSGISENIRFSRISENIRQIIGIGVTRRE